MRKVLLVAVIVVGLIALVGSSPAYAQGTVSKVKVPFQFIVGETVLPAGSYVVTTVAEHPDVLWISSPDGKNVASALVHTTASWSHKTDALFSFQKYGGEYFLSEVSIPGWDTRALPLLKHRVEAMLVKLNSAKAAARGRPTQ